MPLKALYHLNAHTEYTDSPNRRIINAFAYMNTINPYWKYGRSNFAIDISPYICEVYGGVGTPTADDTSGDRFIVCLFAPRGNVLAQVLVMVQAQMDVQVLEA